MILALFDWELTTNWNIYVQPYIGGAGDVAFRVLESIKNVGRRAMHDGLTEIEEDTQIYICDINPHMLNVGKKRAVELGADSQLLLCSFVLFYYSYRKPTI